MSGIVVGAAVIAPGHNASVVDSIVTTPTFGSMVVDHIFLGGVAPWIVDGPLVGQMWPVHP